MKYAGAGALLLPFALLGIVLTWGVNLPYWDEWEYAHFVYLSHLGTLSLADLWQPHQEHRIFLNSVVVLALAKAGGGWDVVHEQCLTVALLVATQAVLWSLIRRTVSQRYAAGVLFVISLALYNVAQRETLSWGAQMNWFMSNLCLVVVVWLLTSEVVTVRRYAAAMAVAALGSLAISQGMIVWIAGLACILLGPDRNRRAIAWTLAGAVVIAVVRVGTYADPKLPHADIATHLPGFVQFTLAYLGSPLARSFGVADAALVGAVLLALIGWLFATDLRDADWRRALAHRLPWYAFALYAVVAAVLAAAVRLGMGVDYALQSRYTTVASLLVIAVIGALGTHLPFASARLRSLATALTVVTVLGVATQSAVGLRQWRDVSVQLHADAASLARGELVGTGLYWNPPRLPALFGELRDAREGIYAP